MNVGEVIPNANRATNPMVGTGSDQASQRATTLFTHMEGNPLLEAGCNSNIPSALKTNLSFQNDCKRDTVSIAIDTKPGSAMLDVSSNQPETDDEPKEIQSSNLANPTPNTKDYEDEIKSTSCPSVEAASTTDNEDTTKSQMKCPWYDVHLAMQRRSSDDWKEFDYMLNRYSYTDLRSKLIAVQQQLEVHHELLDKYEESKAREAKLEKEVKDLQAANAKYKTTAKKLTVLCKKTKKELGERESEIVQLKIDLAHSKGLQDHQNSEVRRMSACRKLLEDENVNLRKLNALLSSKCEDNEKDQGFDKITPQKHRPSFFGLYQQDERKMSHPSREKLRRGASVSSFFGHSQTDERKTCTSSIQVPKQGESFPLVSATYEGSDDTKRNASWDTQGKIFPTSATTSSENRWIKERASWFPSLSRTDECKTSQSSTEKVQRGMTQRWASASSFFSHSQTDERKVCTSLTQVSRQEGNVPLVTSTNEGNDDIRRNASWDTQDIDCPTSTTNKRMQERTPWFPSLSKTDGPRLSSTSCDEEDLDEGKGTNSP